MANLDETSLYEAGVYAIAEDDIVGPASVGGVDNTQATQLANRTKYLKERADEVDGARSTFDSLGHRLNAIEAAAADDDALLMAQAARLYL